MPTADVHAFRRRLEFIKGQYRHCRPLLALRGGAQLLAACGIEIDAADPGLIVATTDGRDAADAFVAAIAKHRHFARETDPPRV